MNRALPSVVALCGLFLGSCAEQKVAFRNTVPVVGISSPVDGAHFEYGSSVQFQGQISDKQDAAESLMVAWETSNADESELDVDAADSTGLLLFNSSLLRVGAHTISLTATDSEGESSTASIEIEVTDVGGGGPVGGEGAPVVSLDNPIDGAVVLQSEPLTILGLVTDDDQEAATLMSSIVSSRDGGLWEGQPDEFGRVELLTTGLSVGIHTIRIDAVDDDANRGSAQVQIEVTEDARPGVVIESPGYGDWFWNTDTIRFEGMVTDDVTHPQDLSVSWASDVDGVFSSLPANPMGATIVETVLGAGFHTITLAATDADLNESQYMIMVEVRDPLDHDGDLDGYTENEGDCDDADPYTHPGAEEICDGRDNDCDGDVNEDDWDDLESNDTLSTATDLGRIDDGWLFSSGETETAGITLHSEYDEDWIRFDAGDDLLIDNVNIDISVGTFPHTGSYVVELYLLDESSTVPVDVDTGSGRLSVEYLGDPWDSGEDDFAVRIYADTWPGGTCGRRFEVEIIDM
jgi:hypothetical protein